MSETRPKTNLPDGTPNPEYTAWYYQKNRKKKCAQSAAYYRKKTLPTVRARLKSDNRIDTVIKMFEAGKDEISIVIATKVRQSIVRDIINNHKSHEQ